MEMKLNWHGGPGEQAVSAVPWAPGVAGEIISGHALNKTNKQAVDRTGENSQIMQAALTSLKNVSLFLFN